MSSLIIKSISKSFGTTKVLDDISLELAEGELLVLLGPSGCGKSTLLRLVAGLEKLDNGEIFINNKRVDHLQPKDRQVAMVFQNYSLYPHMTVEKNLAFPLKIAGEKKEDINVKVANIAEMLGMYEKLKSKPGQLSGGQRQRVALGRAIIRTPELFLLDEPLSNLDADLRIRMRQEIVRLQKDLKITTIHVTHDQAEALTMADRIALLYNGKIVQTGKPEDLYNNPNSLFTAQFIGHPKINIIESKIESDILIPFGLPVSNYNIEKNRDKVLVGIRPEHVKIELGADYSATVAACEYYGEQYVIRLLFKNTELVVSGCKKTYKKGQKLQFSVDKTALTLFCPKTGIRIV